MNILKNILERNFLLLGKKVSLAAVIWFSVFFIFAILTSLRGHTNNFKIFIASFFHLIEEKNLYAAYPAEHHDYFLYGPVFTIVIAFFTIWPIKIGLFLWNLFNCIILFFAIKKLPLTLKRQSLVFLLCCFEMVGNLQSSQSNSLLAASIILSFGFTVRGKEGWGAFFAAFGFLFKIYGCVAFAFLFFAKNKGKFLVALFVNLIIMIAFPIIFSSPEFIFQSYNDWFTALFVKNDINSTSNLQNMSVMRMVNAFAGREVSQIAILSVAAVGVLIPLLRYQIWNSTRFGLLYLSMLLITVVIFSSSAEGPTYIIAMCGAAIWYASQKKLTGWTLYFILFTFVAGSLSTSDLFPRALIDAYIRPLGIKTLPYLVLWLVTIIQLCKPQAYFNNNHEKKDFCNSAGVQ